MVHPSDLDIGPQRLDRIGLQARKWALVGLNGNDVYSEQCGRDARVLGAAMIRNGEFDDIDDVIPKAEREAFMQRYKEAAGFARDELNKSPPLIAPDAWGQTCRLRGLHQR